jgi:hypothetical protein
MRFPQLCDASQLDARCALRLFGLHASANEILRSQGDVSLKLFSKLPIKVARAKHGPNPCNHSVK